MEFIAILCIPYYLGYCVTVKSSSILEFRIRFWSDMLMDKLFSQLQFKNKISNCHFDDIFHHV